MIFLSFRDFCLFVILSFRDFLFRDLVFVICCFEIRFAVFFVVIVDFMFFLFCFFGDVVFSCFLGSVCFRFFFFFNRVLTLAERHPHTLTTKT